METPSSQLASKVLTRLLKENLLSTGDRDKLLLPFSSGKMKPEDWLLAIEKNIESQLK